MPIAAERHSWIIVLAGVLLLAEASRGLATGSTILNNRKVTRSEDPSLYWFSIGMGMALGVSALVFFGLKL